MTNIDDSALSAGGLATPSLPPWASTCVSRSSRMPRVPCCSWPTCRGGSARRSSCTLRISGVSYRSPRSITLTSLRRLCTVGNPSKSKSESDKPYVYHGERHIAHENCTLGYSWLSCLSSALWQVRLFGIVSIKSTSSTSIAMANTFWIVRAYTVMQGIGEGEPGYRR